MKAVNYFLLRKLHQLLLTKKVPIKFTIGAPTTKRTTNQPPVARRPLFEEEQNDIGGGTNLAASEAAGRDAVSVHACLAYRFLAKFELLAFTFFRDRQRKLQNNMQQAGSTRCFKFPGLKGLYLSCILPMELILLNLHCFTYSIHTKWDNPQSCSTT